MPSPPSPTAPRRSSEPEPSDPALRASDAERESAVGLLRDHAAAGRIDTDELEQRIGAAYAARTRGELDELLADLPGTPARRPAVRAPRAPARAGGGEWRAFIRLTALLVAIWALSGGGYFWPAWVLVWWRVPLDDAHRAAACSGRGQHERRAARDRRSCARRAPSARRRACGSSSRRRRRRRRGRRRR